MTRLKKENPASGDDRRGDRRLPFRATPPQGSAAARVVSIARARRPGKPEVIWRLRRCGEHSWLATLWPGAAAAADGADGQCVEVSTFQLQTYDRFAAAALAQAGVTLPPGPVSWNAWMDHLRPAMAAIFARPGVSARWQP